jgi:hypothetical protein
MTDLDASSPRWTRQDAELLAKEDRLWTDPTGVHEGIRNLSVDRIAPTSDLADRDRVALVAPEACTLKPVD